jgi:SAM-dependent methyltransferase
MPRAPSDEELLQMSERTLAHYTEAAGTFWDGTKGHDVTQNYDALLGAIEGEPPFAILDFGCGPGRDLRYFRSLGHRAVGLEGCAEFANMARAYSGCDVLEQNFLSMSLPAATFDGIFANASLFHVPTKMLARVLGELAASLKPRGVLFSSNPRGRDEEGWNIDRYGCYHSLETWRRFLADAGFTELTHYYRPSGLPRHEQRWLATVYRKT